MMPIFSPQPFAACKDMHDGRAAAHAKTGEEVPFLQPLSQASTDLGGIAAVLPTSRCFQGAPRRVQVPSHVLRVFSDDAGQEKVEIQVDLPGTRARVLLLLLLLRFFPWQLRMAWDHQGGCSAGARR